MNATPDRKPVPRGLRQDGPVLLSYGFRPFFLFGSAFAAVAMAIWMAALAYGLEPGGSYGASHWHAHEMLFGYAPAVLAGFLLTAIPNWTGRLPVSGPPLAGLLAIWAIGRLAMLDPDRIGILLAAAADMAFLPAMLAVALREVIAGRKWKDMKVVAPLGVLIAANFCFHYAMATGDHPGTAMRLAISAYTLLVLIIGGRIIPSFTRNFMAKDGRKDAPAAFGRFDGIAILGGLAALASWVWDPETMTTSVLGAVAAGLHLARLARWKGLAVRREKLLFVLHVAYFFVPAGFAAIALGGAEILDEVTVLHVLTIGAISAMMLAVMTRATRGHTGRNLASSATTRASYALLFLAAVLRPLSDLVADWQEPMVYAAGASFICAFVLFGIEHFPMLAARRRSPLG